MKLISFLLVAALCLPLTGCFEASLGARSIRINADPGIEWTAVVGSQYGGARTIRGTGSHTIDGYDCATVSKDSHAGKICVNIIMGNKGSAAECTEADFGSVSVCDPM